MTDLLRLFHPVVGEWFRSRFGEPSPPQRQGWPAIAAGQHTLILAPTGSGKTLAAFLWCIDDLFRASLAAEAESFQRNRSGVHTLYISPLKALNNDIHRNLQEPLSGIYARASNCGLMPARIHVAVRTGDTLPAQRAAMLRKPPHILITTPESLFLLITSEKGRALFSHLRQVIVDEIHSLSNNKRGVHLSLTLERLMSLCDREPVRIGLSATQRPLERIAHFLGGQPFDPQKKEWLRRPVTIVDCGQRREMDVRVISPIAEYGDLPEGSIWPAVHEKLYELILAHRSTLVFVNLRAQSEKIARLLNDLHRERSGDAGAVLAMPHHGSLSREMRHDIEARLKEGRIPAVIATASLELGIDIGSIDLVVQLGAPRSVSGALQRVGRSGHLLKATSKGRIVPLHSADLDDCLAITAAMKTGDIEETVVPENCLDVLAQQIVAEVAMKTWPRNDLYRLVRSSGCYERLSPEAFDRVVQMLCGDLSEGLLRGAGPRISWDRVNDRLIARRGSRLLAVMNMGTIPDRAYYGVYLAGQDVKLGEVEEEFVFESRIGDHFFLGNQEWRIEAIDRNQIRVVPMAAANPRAPFWKGDSLFRDRQTSDQTGELRRKLEDAEQAPAVLAVLSDLADEAVLNSLLRYFDRQRRQTGMLPTARVHLGESFIDSAGQFYLVWHAPVGARVTGLMAILLAAQLQKRYRLELQYSFDDDGFALRLPEPLEPLPWNDFLNTPVEEMRRDLLNTLIDSPTFAVQFRHVAARALLLPRSQPRKRIPLWLQRLRAADLLQEARQIPDFPLVVETYRECLHQVFDWDAFQLVMEKLTSQAISFHAVQTPSPSIMAAGLLFKFISNNMYEADRTRLPSQAASISGALLAEVMARDEIPRLVTADLVLEAETRWQNLAPSHQARDAEDLYALLQRLGPMTASELQRRSREDPRTWLMRLEADGRIAEDPIAQRWRVIGTDKEKGAATAIDGMVLHWLASHGPVSEAEIARDLGISAEALRPALASLTAQGAVVSGQLLQDRNDFCWCDRENFAELYRRAIGRRRLNARPLSGEELYSFMFAWHKIGDETTNTAELMHQYRAWRLPLHFLVAELSRVRMRPESREMFQQQLAECVRSGEYILRARRDAEGGRTEIDWIGRGEGGYFSTIDEQLQRAGGLDPAAQSIWDFLRENGASHFRDLVEATSLSSGEVQSGLADLCEEGLVSCDDLPAFEQLLEMRAAAETPAANETIESRSYRGIPAGFRPRRIDKRDIRKRLNLHQGRWFLLSSFGVMGRARGDERAEFQARLLLDRHGIVVKEWYRREKGLLPWPELFRVLKRMEWRGEIRRGYFLAGVSGVQFALPEAVELIERLRNGDRRPPGGAILLSMLDPSLPFGGSLPWPLIEGNEANISPVRGMNNYLLVIHDRPAAYLENHGRRIFLPPEHPDQTIGELCLAFKQLLRQPATSRPKNRIIIETIDGYAASAHQQTEIFIHNGFEMDGKLLILWPSRSG